jgi:Mg2+ and Co2+ transporter CorA
MVYTVNLQNQLESANLDREIRDMTKQMTTLAEETGAVTKKLHELTRNTVDDSAIVSIITIVSAIYLPGSFVSVSQ